MALLAAAIVTSLTVDLGPVGAGTGPRREGSKYIERPLHIGALRIHLLSGQVLVEDLTIDGLHDGDRPFFTAKRLSVSARLGAGDRRGSRTSRSRRSR